MEFTLIKELTGLTLFQWLLFAVCLTAVIAAIAFLMRRQEQSAPQTSQNKQVDTAVLVTGALCIALSFVLSYIRLFKLPQGGSITLASMLPIMLYGYWYGPRRGFIAAFAYAILQFIQDPYFLNFAQFMLDYILGFTAVGLTSLLRKHLYLGILFSGSVRLFCSFLSGFIFFAAYAPKGINPALYSLLYQLSTIGIDTLICLVIAFALMRTHIFDRLHSRSARTSLHQ